MAELIPLDVCQGDTLLHQSANRTAKAVLDCESGALTEHMLAAFPVVALCERMYDIFETKDLYNLIPQEFFTTVLQAIERSMDKHDEEDLSVGNQGPETEETTKSNSKRARTTNPFEEETKTKKVKSGNAKKYVVDDESEEDMIDRVRVSSSEGRVSSTSQKDAPPPVPAGSPPECVSTSKGEGKKGPALAGKRFREEQCWYKTECPKFIQTGSCSFYHTPEEIEIMKDMRYQKGYSGYKGKTEGPPIFDHYAPQKGPMSAPKGHLEVNWEKGHTKSANASIPCKHRDDCYSYLNSGICSFLHTREDLESMNYRKGKGKKGHKIEKGWESKDDAAWKGWKDEEPLWKGDWGGKYGKY